MGEEEAEHFLVGSGSRFGHLEGVAEYVDDLAPEAFVGGAVGYGGEDVAHALVG